MEVDRSTVISNMLWRFAEKCGTQVVSFIVTLVLARLLYQKIMVLYQLLPYLQLL